MEVVFATSNAHKVTEVRALLGDDFRIRTLEELGWQETLPETSDTLAENALQKARHVADALEMDCFAEDTGLEVDALDGRPGVYSARYAGYQRDAGGNMRKVLDEMREVDQRGAQFRTVVALILDGAAFCFHGIVRGTLTREPRGTGGFGYDPIFVPEGFSQTFAEQSLAEKGAISHRARAIEKLTAFLKDYLRRKNPG